MRFIIALIILIVLVLLSGCTGCNDESAESLGLRAGAEVTVQKGFYKGCSGILTQYYDYCASSDTVSLAAVSCQEGKTTMNTLQIKAKDLRK